MPVPPRPAPGPGAVAALPYVGALLGGCAGAAGWGVSRILPAPLGAVAAYGALAFLTGAIHLDGFLDGCDAFVAAVPPERRLEILKDPRHGTFAVAGMFVAGAAALAALANVPPRRYPATLAFAATVARAAAACGAFVFPGARDPRGTSHFARSPETSLALFAALALGMLGGRRFGPRGVLLVPAAVATALLCEAWIARRLGGLTGDAYGFTIVVVETEILAALAALARE